jgi:O-antigen ligase
MKLSSGNILSENKLMLSIFILTPAVLLFLTHYFHDVQMSLYFLIAATISIAVTLLIIQYPIIGLFIIIVYSPFTNLFPIPLIASGSRLIGLLVIISWLLKYFLFQKTVFFELMKFNKLLICLMSSIIISSIFAEYSVVSLKASFVIIISIIMCIFMQDLINTENKFKILITSVALSSGLASLIVLIQYSIASGGGEAFGTVGYSGSGDIKRIGGFDNPNAFANLLMSGIPLLLFNTLNAKRLVLKTTCFILFITSVISLGLTVARTYIFTFIVFILAYVFLGVKNKFINTKQLIVLLLIVIFLSISLSSFLLDIIMGRSLVLEDDSSQKRFLILERGVDLLIEHPLNGIGFNNLALMDVSSDKYAWISHGGGHDIVSIVFASIGLPGSILLIYILYKIFSYINLAAKSPSIKNDKYLFNLIITLKAAFIAFLSSSFGNGLIVYKTFWIYVAIAVVVYRWSTMTKSTPNNSLVFNINKSAR